MLIKRKVSLLFFLYLFLFLKCTTAEDLFLGVTKEKYLLGDYQGVKIHKNRKGEPLMRPDVLEAFEKMVISYEIERAVSKNSEKIIVKSGFRSYTDQKTIWEEKFTGKRKMKKSVENKKPQEIVPLILEYSSAPGTSRHHWGTDLDLNSFENSYFEKGGKGEFLYTWLQKNAATYGFCQPYNDYSERDNKGYFLERWHWSYFPISSKLQQEWLDSYKDKKINIKGKFLGSETMHDELPLVYVSSVNKSCLGN
jgi:LAS superfamily LD-carboxypeptidase LdcB